MENGQLKTALLFRAESLKKRAIVCTGMAAVMLIGYAASILLALNPLVGIALAILGMISLAAAVVCGVLNNEVQTIAQKVEAE